MEVLSFETRDWQSGPVFSASTFLERWRGLKRLDRDASLIMRTSSVHGIGIVRPFRAVGLTKDFKVIGSQVVRPGRVVRFAECEWILELPEETTPPQPGSVLELVDG